MQLPGTHPSSSDRRSPDRNVLVSDFPRFTSGKMSESTKIVEVNVEEGFRPLAVEARYSQVLLVVRLAGSVAGHVSLPACTSVSAEAQEAAVLAELGDVLWERLVRLAFARATRASRENHPDPTVSVIVLASSGGEKLRACLESIVAIDTPPLEIFVVDEGASGEDVADISSAYAAHHLGGKTEPPSSARNAALAKTRAELVAFTNDACMVDRGWLDGLGVAFSDPLVMAMTGYVGPRDLETPEQRLADVVGGALDRHVEPQVVRLPLFPVRDAASFARPGNAVFRRSAFKEITLLPALTPTSATAFPAAEAYALYRILAKGYRVVFDPARVVWRPFPSDCAEPPSTLFEWATGLSAYAVRCLLDGELDAIRFYMARSWAQMRALVRLGWPTADAIIVHGRGALRGLRWTLRSDWQPSAALAPATPFPEKRGQRIVQADTPTLSVVIPSRNRRTKLAKALDAFARQAYPLDRLEVLVVLDGSTDGSAELVRSLEVPYRLQLVEQEHEGVAAARNRGAREARHSILVFSDDDVLPEVDFLAAHAAAHRRNDDGKAVVLGYCPPAVKGERLWEMFLRAAWEDFYRRLGEPDHQWTYMDFASGSISLARSFFLSAGGFDSEFRRRSEDPELGIRLLRQGARPEFCRQARASHDLDTHVTTGLRQAREVGEYDVLLVSKHPEIAPRVGGVSALLRPTAEGVSSRAVHAYRHPRASQVLARLALPLLEMCDRLRLRQQWHALLSALLTHSYVLGLRDALPAYEDFRAFVAAVSHCEYDEVVRVDLDEAGSVRIPPAAIAPAVELAYARQPLARIGAIEPGAIWDWEALTERVVSEALDALRNAVAFDELLDLLRPELRMRLDL